jgi:hypothetical protein
MQAVRVAKISFARLVVPGAMQLHLPPVRTGVSPTLARCRSARTHETAGGGKGFSPRRSEPKCPFPLVQLHCFDDLLMEEAERLAGLVIQIQNPRLCSRGKGSQGSTCPQCRSRVGSVALWGRVS